MVKEDPNTLCFHCSEPLPKNFKSTALIQGHSQPVCCLGCKAVAEFIDEQGYKQFYDYRGDSTPHLKADPSEEQWLKYDDPSYLKVQDSGTVSVRIRVDGMYCSACSWLLDKHLKQLSGVHDVALNTMTRQMQVTFDRKQISFSQILTAVNHLGYIPMVSQDDSEDISLTEKRKSMKRLIVAGIGMMQVMTISVPLYAESSEIEPSIQRFFELISLLVATWVYFYSGTVFVKNALRDLRNRHLGMDVPVALSISLAYFVSVWNTLVADNSIIYFDSMIMFVFFLLAGRFVEMNVRHQGMNSSEAMSTLIPSSVTRIQNDETQIVPLAEIKRGDLLSIKAGETIPCDGVIKQGQLSVNEAIMTGEASPIVKKANDKVMAGTLVVSGQAQMESVSMGDETFLAQLGHMLESAQLQRPKTLMIIDKVAAWFVAIVLILALSVAAYYWVNDPQMVMPIVLAVLVATCPCALSLATPTVLTAASVRLMKKGVLIQNLDALNIINKRLSWFFDKTGTLTSNQLQIDKVVNHSEMSDTELLNLMANMERNSSHPLASAFNEHFKSQLKLDDVNEVHGKGISAQWQGKQWKLGSSSFCKLQNDGSLFLTADDQLIAELKLKSSLREGAEEVIKWLQPRSTSVHLLSGDQQQAVQEVAEALRLSNVLSAQSPQDKINRIHEQQKQGQSTVMVGDGVNDAPVLAQSNVSISLSQGTHLARTAADFILISQSLAPIKHIYKTAVKAQNIIKENITWALIYNLSVTPLAMMGYLKPWMAAIGMSISSLIVVLNSRRV